MHDETYKKLIPLGLDLGQELSSFRFGRREENERKIDCKWGATHSE